MFWRPRLPDADDTKTISVLLANTAELLPIANHVELMVLEWTDGQLVLDGTWRVYHSHRSEPPSRSIQTISDRGIAQQAFTEKRLISIPDLRQTGLPSSAYGGDEGIFSALAAPVYHGKQVVGVLLAASNYADAFTGRDEVRRRTGIGRRVGDRQFPPSPGITERCTQSSRGGHATVVNPGDPSGSGGAGPQSCPGVGLCDFVVLQTRQR